MRYTWFRQALAWSLAVVSALAIVLFSWPPPVEVMQPVFAEVVNRAAKVSLPYVDMIDPYIDGMDVGGIDVASEGSALIVVNGTVYFEEEPEFYRTCVFADITQRPEETVAMKVTTCSEDEAAFQHALVEGIVAPDAPPDH